MTPGHVCMGLLKTYHQYHCDDKMIFLQSVFVYAGY